MKSKTRLKDKMVVRVVAISFISVLLTFALLTILTFLLFIFGKWEINIPSHFEPMNSSLIFILAIIISLFVGLLFSIFVSTRFLQPLTELKKMTSKVAKGDFTVQMKEIPENEFGEFMKDFNVMVRELRKNEMLKNDFVSNVSHEFKTPLAVIEGYATLLQDSNLDEESKEKYTKVIVEATKKLSNLVNNVLKISRIDNRKITINNETFSLDEQIRESILLYQEEWSNKNINFEIDLEEVDIVGDKSLLSNVWNNLISNAIKFSHENSTIFVNLTKENNNAKFVIKDEGCGIDIEDIPYIFDKFFQSDKSHKSQGNGLGLTLVKEIVTLSKGKIEVESKLGKGTSFIVYLPINL